MNDDLGDIKARVEELELAIGQLKNSLQRLSNSDNSFPQQAEFQVNEPPAPLLPRPTKRDMEFLFEMGCIRFIDRMWVRFMGTNFANLAEHHFRMFWIAMVIADYEGGDTAKIAKMVLVHDIAESRTGDVDYLARQYTKRNEELGIADMLEGTALRDEFMNLIHEYEERTSLEAKIVKDADNLDVSFELAEQDANGVKLKDAWLSQRKFVHDKKLYTQTAQKITEMLNTTNPHDWHINGRNRLRDGDWQK